MMTTLTTEDGVTLHYEFDEGAGEAPAVVFLNGMTQSTAHWKTQVRRFAGELRVLTYDARGQGQTDLGGASVEMERHVDDLGALLDHLEIERAHLVGFSHGARVALGFAAGRPRRVRRLVLCSLTAEPTTLARTIVESWSRVLEHGGLEAMSWAALPNILGDAYLEENEEILEGIVRAAVRRNDESGIRALLDAMESYPSVAEMASRSDVPTLVLSASEDLLVETSGAQALAEQIGGEHVEIDGVGHTIPIEAPDRFHRHVRTFLGGEAEGVSR